MDNTATIYELLKRPVAYQPVLAKAFGCVKLGIFWSQLYYWSDKTKDKDGWIYKTKDQIYDETGLTRKNQETARALGKQLGILEEKRTGRPAKMHYKINTIKAIEIISKWSQAKGQLELFKKDKKKQIDQVAVEIVKILDIFREINPGINYGHKTHRKACQELIKQYGIDMTIRLAKYAVSVQGDKYAPVITTPYQFKEKLAQLQIYNKKANKDRKKLHDGNYAIRKFGVWFSEKQPDIKIDLRYYPELLKE